MKKENSSRKQEEKKSCQIKAVCFFEEKTINDNLGIDLVVKLYVSYYGGTIYLVLSNLSDFCGFQK